MFMFDIETLDTESTAVILSASIIQFDLNETYTYEQLLEKALFVKFDVKEQIENYKRTISKQAVEWWGKQHSHVRKLSVTPSEEDVSASEGLLQIKEYITKHSSGQDEAFWARGSLDQMAIDSLSYKLGIEPIAPYYVWRDVRTAVDILCESSNNGYCTVKHPSFQQHQVIKHHPTHDCALDIMMLMYGV